MEPSASVAGLAWHVFTRLGEAQILLPAMLAACAWLVWRADAARLARAWLVLTAAAALVTTATKIAFIGYGIGWAPLDYTGVSGHAMFAAAILPLLLRLGEGTLPARWHGALLPAGYLLAAAVGYSRLPTRSHSASEVLAGLALGALASGLALRLAHAPRLRVPLWLPLALLLWLGSTMSAAPPSPTHGWVTSIALALSGRDAPYTRADQRRRWRLEQRERAAARSLPPRQP